MTRFCGLIEIRGRVECKKPRFFGVTPGIPLTMPSTANFGHFVPWCHSKMVNAHAEGMHFPLSVCFLRRAFGIFQIDKKKSTLVKFSGYC